MDPKGIAIVVAILMFFFYVPTPSITSVAPNSGTNDGMMNVVVSGAKFDQNTTVKLVMKGQEDIKAAAIQVISGDKLFCSFDLKDRAIGKWDVIVANKMFKSATLTDGFMIGYPAPMVKTINPKQAYNNAPISVELEGVAFRTGAAVMLTNRQMDIGATKIKVNSDSHITCEFNLNEAELGIYNVKVVNDDGKSGILSKGFSIDGILKPIVNVIKPVIDAIEPNKGFNNGMILTTITGSNFEQDSSVKLSRNGQLEIPGLNIKVNDPTKVSCFFDISGQPEGEYDLEIISPSGQKAILTRAFTIEHFTPNSLELNKSLKPVYFDFNKAEIRKNQMAALEADLGILKEYSKLYILLGGHTDERGTIEYNLELSERRANAIKKYLLEKGIEPKRITIYAYGKKFPLKVGHSESSWWQNRRVDIMVWEAPPTKEQGIKGTVETSAKK